MRLPKSFNDVTVKQYQDVYFLFLELKDPSKDDFQVSEIAARIVSILSCETYETIADLSTRELKNLIKRIDFITRPEVLQEKVKQYILAGKSIYKAQTKAGKLSTSAVLSIKGYQTLDPKLDVHENTVVNMHNMLAAIYLPWHSFRYKSSRHEKIANDMLHAKMGDVYGTLFFYSVLYEELTKGIEVSMKEAQSVLTEHFKEIQESLPENSLEKSGAGR